MKHLNINLRHLINRNIYLKLLRLTLIIYINFYKIMCMTKRDYDSI